MDNLELEQFRRVLGDLAGSLARSLLRRDDIAIDNSGDVIDQVQNAADRERAVHQLERSSADLYELKRALARLDAGTYGICERCDSQISIIRLQAVPWAAHCIECQNWLDRASIELRVARRASPGIGAGLFPRNRSGRFPEGFK